VTSIAPVLALSTDAAAIVRAIQRAMNNPLDGPRLVRFTVLDVL
jgi:hypothetical protein